MSLVYNIRNLEIERDRVNRELEKLKGAAVPYIKTREVSPFGKREEDADESLELEKRIILEKNLTDTLLEINHALEKYQQDTYGICDRCGLPVQAARLEALPYASLCLNCKSKQLKESRGRSLH
jgi:DnaK suppressor protein